MATQYTAADAPVTVLSTELNSLADATLASLSSAQSNDQTGEFDIMCDAELVIAAQGSARAADAVVELYIVPTLDGTNYPDTSTDELLAPYYVGSFPLDAATTSRRVVIEGLRLPNSDFKVGAKNDTGQAFAASGSTIKLARYTYRDV